MYDYLKRTSKQYYPVLIILFITPALYAYNPFPLYFLNDDFIHVPLSQSAVWGQRNSIRPFNDFSLFIDSLIWKNNAVGYHLTNLILHLLNSLAVYILARILLRKIISDINIKFWSTVTAVFFTGYAFHSEGVFWVIGRTSCMASLLFLICFIIFLSGYRTWYFFLISYVCFLLGLLTYESLFMLPPTLILFTLFFREFRKKTDVLLIAGYVPVFIYYLILRVRWTGGIASDYEGGNIKVLNFPVLLTNYLELVARSFVAPQVRAVFFVATLLFFFMLLFVLFWRHSDKEVYKLPFFVLLLTLLMSYLPYVSLGIDTHGVESERYLYLPSIFVCLLLVAIAASFRNKELGLLVLFLYFLYHQYYLLKSSNAFVVSSGITKTTMDVIRENKTAANFYFVNLPQENYGVPIFRLGLQEGVIWQTGNSRAGARVKTISLNENQFYFIRKKLQPLLCDTSSFTIATVLPERLPGATDERLAKYNDVVFNPATDLLLQYTDSSIKIFKPTDRRN